MKQMFKIVQNLYVCLTNELCREINATVGTVYQTY